MQKISDLYKDILLSCEDDYTRLDEIIYDVKKFFNVTSAQEIQNKTLEVIKDLLGLGFIEVSETTGGKDGEGFNPWNLSPKESIDRIKKEWDALGREPNIGDIAWFLITLKGKQELRKLLIDLPSDILLYCYRAYVSVWSIIKEVKFFEKETLHDDPKKVRDRTLVVLKDLLESGLIKAGFSDDGHDLKMNWLKPQDSINDQLKKWNWNLSPGDSIDRIKKEWDALGREPGLNDIAFFLITQKGYQKLRKLHKDLPFRELKSNDLPQISELQIDSF